MLEGSPLRDLFSFYRVFVLAQGLDWRFGLRPLCWARPRALSVGLAHLALVPGIGQVVVRGEPWGLAPGLWGKGSAGILLELILLAREPKLEG